MVLIIIIIKFNSKNELNFKTPGNGCGNDLRRHGVGVVPVLDTRNRSTGIEYLSTLVSNRPSLSMMFLNDPQLEIPLKWLNFQLENVEGEYC